MDPSERRHSDRSDGAASTPRLDAARPCCRWTRLNRTRPDPLSSGWTGVVLMLRPQELVRLRVPGVRKHEHDQSYSNIEVSGTTKQRTALQRAVTQTTPQPAGLRRRLMMKKGGASNKQHRLLSKIRRQRSAVNTLKVRTQNVRGLARLQEDGRVFLANKGQRARAADGSDSIPRNARVGNRGGGCGEEVSYKLGIQRTCASNVVLVRK